MNQSSNSQKNIGRIGVLISGRGSNLKSIMDACEKGEVRARVAVVLSNKEDAAGLEYARKAGIEASVLPNRQYQNREEYDGKVVEILQQHQVDLVCLAGFMRLLSGVMIKAFPLRIMNIHPAILPAFPGLHAQRQAVEYGAKITGCTV